MRHWPWHWLRFAPGRTLGHVALLGVLTLASAPPPAKAQAPAPATTDDATSPARFVRADHAFFYLEYDGLDAHAEAWRKTAAYKILNETPTGAMLEDLLKQIVARSPVAATINGDEMVALIKHLAQAGFTFAINPIVSPDKSKEDGAVVIVLRGAFSNKAVAPIVARILQKAASPDTKMTSVVKSGHKVVTGKRNQSPFYWWVEETKKADVIFVTGPPTSNAIDYVLDAVDGRAPSILTHPVRTELAQPRDGFERVGLAFFDPSPFRGGSANDAKLPQSMDNAGIRLIDLTMGFQSDALMSVTRIHATDSTKLNAAWGSTFERGALPSFPANSYAFLAVAANLKAMPGALRADPRLGPGYEKAAADLKEKTKIRLDEDIFGQLGPKVMMSVAPSKAAEAGGGAAGGLGALAQMGMGLGGADALPKVALLLDVADSKAFGKTLDEFVGFTNRQIKATIAQQAAAMGGADAAAGPGAGARRGGSGGPAAPEFRPVTSGDGKSYVLNVPPEMAKSVPGNLRPAIRLGAKQLALATSADAARQALEGKGNYTPPADLADGFNRLPAKLNGLFYLDTRSMTPATLAALPGKLQQMVGTVGAIQAAQMGGAAPPPVTFSVDPGKLPTADAIRQLLFPSVYTVDRDGDALRITTREPFPPVADPSVLAALLLPAVQAARGAAQRQQAAARPQPNGPTDGFFDVPKRDDEAPKPQKPSGPAPVGIKRPVGRSVAPPQ